MAIKSRTGLVRGGVFLVPFVALFVLLMYSCNYDNTTGPASLHSLTTSVSPEGGGTVVAPDGEFDDGEEVEIEAVPSEDYLFARWEGDLTGNQNPDTLTFDSDKHVTAIFMPREYTLHLETEGEGSVREEIVQEKSKTDYEYGTRVRLTAEPDTGWQFARWEGDIESEENPLTLTIEEPMSLTAVFVQPGLSGEITVTTNPVTEIDSTSAVSGGEISITGSLTVSLRGVCWNTDPGPTTDHSCTDNGSGDTDFSSTLLQLTPSTTYYVRAYANYDNGTSYGNEREFITEDSPGNGDEGSEEGDGEISITTSEVTEISVTSAESGGEITDDGGKDIFIRGVCWDTATSPDTDDNCTGNGSGTGTYTSQLTNLNAETTYFVRAYATNEDGTAYGNEREFTTDEAPVAEFTINFFISGRGSVSLSPDQESWEEGAEVTLTAEPDEGSQFIEWDGDLQGSENPASLMMNEDKTIVVVFEDIDYFLNLSSDGPGSVSADPDQESYTWQDQVTLTASPDEGATFTGWTGDATGTENPTTITIDGDKSVTAQFEAEEFTLNLQSSGPGTATADPQQESYRFGDQVTLSATPDEGATFTGWTGDATGTENPTTITIDSDKSVTAQFEAEQYTLEISVNGPNSVERDPDQETYTFGQEVGLTAVPAEGWEFVRWEGDLEGNNPSESIFMDGNKTISAVFEQNDD